MGDEVGGGSRRGPSSSACRPSSVATSPFGSLTSKLEAGVSWEFESKRAEDRVLLGLKGKYSGQYSEARAPEELLG